MKNLYMYYSTIVITTLACSPLVTLAIRGSSSSTVIQYLEWFSRRRFADSLGVRGVVLWIPSGPSGGEGRGVVTMGGCEG